MENFESRLAQDVPAIDQATKEKGECMMCKFVLIFSFIVLLLVLLLVFFLNVAPNLEFAPTAPTETSVSNVSAVHERVLELQKQPTTNVAK